MKGVEKKSIHEIKLEVMKEQIKRQSAFQDFMLQHNLKLIEIKKILKK